MDLQQYLPLLTGGGPTALLALTILAIVTGRLVPKSTHDQVIAEKDVQIRILERVADNYRQTLEKKDGLIPAQLESAQTVEKLALALQQGLAAKAEESGNSQ